MDIKQKTLKGALSAFLAVAVNYAGMIAVPIIMLCVVMLLDYITGMVAAWRSRELSSKKGSFGIIKKLCYLIAVCVGIIVDWVIYSGLDSMGVSLGIRVLFGVIIAIWLIINELLSIVENLRKIGVPLPAFLEKIVRRLKNTTEVIVTKEDKKR